MAVIGASSLPRGARQFSFHLLAAGADLLDRLLHGRCRLPGFLRLIADLVILSAGDARAILLPPAAGLFPGFCHAGLLIPRANARKDSAVPQRPGADDGGTNS